MSTVPKEKNRIRCEPVPCPQCGRLYRPNFRQGVACSTVCIEARRNAQGITGNQLLKNPSWTRKRA